MNYFVSFTVTFFNLLAENDFHLVFQRLTLCQGTSNGNVQSLVVDITDDSLVEGTESFVISGSATAPASFVPGQDLTTVKILDNDGECGLCTADYFTALSVHTQNKEAEVAGFAYYHCIFSHIQRFKSNF